MFACYCVQHYCEKKKKYIPQPRGYKIVWNAWKVENTNEQLFETDMKHKFLLLNEVDNVCAALFLLFLFFFLLPNYDGIWRKIAKKREKNPTDNGIENKNFSIFSVIMSQNCRKSWHYWLSHYGDHR